MDAGIDLRARTVPSMSKWNSAEWADLRSGKTCPICLQGNPRDVVLELGASYLTSTAAAPLRGYCCIVLKRHAVELHELALSEAALFLKDVQRVGRALQEVTRAIKLNYEIHGNTVPHLHMHLYPRHAGDAFEGRPIDARAIGASPYANDEFSVFVTALRARLADG